MNFLRYLAPVLLLCGVNTVQASDASAWIQDTLANADYGYEACSAESAAIKGTMARVKDITLPDYGKVIVVNIPSGVVTAYEDGIPVIESKAVVGKAATQTPEMNTHVTFVRPNPTWTVPRSIIKRNKWLERLSSDPDFFERNNFRIMSGGEAVSAYQAADNPEAVDSFIQMPGPGNALGSIKIGIENNQAIYLHDTNDPGKFDAEVRAASAGCVRIEHVTDIASWILGISPSEMHDLIDSGNIENLKPSENVKVILGYWTAWPDKSGSVRFYPDIYGKDEVCGRHSGQNSEPYVVEPYLNEQADAPKPRFIPGPVGNTPPTPKWTEYEAR